MPYRMTGPANLAADSEDLTFCTVFDSRCGNRIGETGNRDQPSGTAEFSYFRINIQTSQNNTDKDQQKRTPVSGSFFVSSYRRCGVQDKLTENTDQSASQECFQHV